MLAVSSSSQDSAVPLAYQELEQFVQVLLKDALMQSGEPAWEHARGVAQICQMLGLDENARSAALLFNVWWVLDKEQHEKIQTLEEKVPQTVKELVRQILQLLNMGGISKDISSAPLNSTNKNAAKLAAEQLDILRRMLLAMAPDIRVVLIRLASRLQTLRWYAASKTQPPADFAQESLMVYAPLANRLGVWQLKWEMEDLAFRFKEPQVYQTLARALEEKRIERENFIARSIHKLANALAASHIKADVAGRPKHIYSIHHKMQKKNLPLEGLYDLRALRVLVNDLKDSYTALGIVHQLWTPIAREFDDYIARPKANGYQSLHTVVTTEDQRPLEVQIRTHAMHQHAEFGVAAHWRYKETASASGLAPSPAAGSEQDKKIAWLRQLLAWKKEVTEAITDEYWQIQADDRIYVLTPQGRVIELVKDATPIDFAYHLHSELGHKCRGAKVDGVMVPLSTPLRTGQTVEIIADKKLTSGPSRDWLNPELAFLQSPRARAKVRAWFNATEQQQDIQTGRTIVERELQRLGKTAVNLQELAAKLGFEKPEELFLFASKAEFHPRSIETAFEHKTPEDPDALVRARVDHLSDTKKHTKASVLVVGVDVLTQLARCCKPAPPDLIGGYITRGKGVSIHRLECNSFKSLLKKDPDRVIECTWGDAQDAIYAVEVRVLAVDRPGLLRDISEVFAKERINVTAVTTQSSKGQARMGFAVQIKVASQLERALLSIGEIKGVLEARRR